MKRKKVMKKGFTLAEVLVTLGIIGVITALMLGVVVPEIGNRVREEQKRMAQYKLTKATEAMTADGKMGAYPSTMDFVNEFKNYYNIAKICDADHLTECWPYDKIYKSDGETIEVSELTNGYKLGVNEADFTGRNFNSPNVALVTTDGLFIIMAFDTNCATLGKYDQFKWESLEGDEGKPVTNATTGCIVAYIDIDGTDGENELGQDIITLNLSKLNQESCPNNFLYLPETGGCFRGTSYLAQPFCSNEERCNDAWKNFGYGGHCSKDTAENDWYYWAHWDCHVTFGSNLEKPIATMDEINEFAKLVYNLDETPGNGEIKNLTYNAKSVTSPAVNMTITPTTNGSCGGHTRKANISQAGFYIYAYGAANGSSDAPARYFGANSTRVEQRTRSNPGDCDTPSVVLCRGN